jgi:hypothetical protein
MMKGGHMIRRGVCLAAFFLAGCGTSPITSTRIERALETTFANLVELQVSRMGLRPMTAPDFAVTAICRRQADKQYGDPASGIARWSGRVRTARRYAIHTISSWPRTAVSAPRSLARISEGLP